MASSVKVSIQRVTSLPVTAQPNTIYICKDVQNATLSYLGITGTDGRLLTTMHTDTVKAIIESEFARLNPPNPVIKTYSLANIGDACEMILDDVIRLRYEKTSNTGYETYQANLFSIASSRTIGYRRDTFFNNINTEGANSNSLILSNRTGYQVDNLVYGSMREYTRIVVVDYVSGVSWKIEVFGFGTGKLRFIVERQQDTK